jgi:hypothetical protein
MLIMMASPNDSKSYSTPPNRTIRRTVGCRQWAGGRIFHYSKQSCGPLRQQSDYLVNRHAGDGCQ